MNRLARLPLGFVALGLLMLTIDWFGEVGLSGPALGCLVGGTLAFSWRLGRHYQCG